MKRLRALLRLVAPLALVFGFTGLANAAPPPVVVVPIHGTVDDGMAHLVERAVQQANDEHAQAIVLDVNSPGGLVEAAFRIRDALFAAKVPVIAYVSERAYSAAALITLSANRIVMAPGSSIGAAEPIPATVKTISALRAEFESTALRNHRNVAIAGAMVDRHVDLPAYKATGTILTLNTREALSSGVADAIAPSLDAALASQRLSGAPRDQVDYSFGEEVARFATTPEISGLLLTLGMLGLILEMQTLHGVAGTVGVAALALFFGTHVYAGFSNGLVVALAIVGLLGILWELHVVPGHGAPGILGAIALLAAVLLAFGVPFFFIAIETVSTAIIVTVALFALVTRAYPENAWMKRLAFVGVQGADYVASADLTALRGAVGTASSFLRPAGIATIDGQRVDVLTEGEFIQAGTPIRVTRVEGARVFVEPVTLPDYT
ncbi:MAG: ATP-dependent Clp protease proteolytic subunit [bacterium]|nr:ATP-dependent Clp protease proteolytic subunit [bacterium]